MAMLLILLGQASSFGAERVSGVSNVPPPGFTALFNGKDFTGWQISPKAKLMWSIEDGVLKSPGLLREWGADLVTEKAYRDFVLLLDFRMPTLSDSGIMFRRLIPEIPNFGDQEQFNLRSKDGVGQLESFYFLPHGIARNRKLREEEEPHPRIIDPTIGVWHTVKLTMQGRTLSAEYDGEVLYDRYTYPNWMMSLEPAPIRLQKHVFFDDDVIGKMNPCPIEFRKIFIKDLGPAHAEAATTRHFRSERKQKVSPVGAANAALLAQIDSRDLPKSYDPAHHQLYVDRHMAALSAEQRGTIVRLWHLKEMIDPDMANRGNSFVKIMTYVANGEKPPAETNKQPSSIDDAPAKLRGAAPESRSSKPVHRWHGSAEKVGHGRSRQARPTRIPGGPTIYGVLFGLLEDDHPPVVLLPGSQLVVDGHLAAAQPVYCGITVYHPNGDFAGRFLTRLPADQLPSGQDFRVALDLNDVQLDPSLAGREDKLPTKPFHFVVESISFWTVEQDAGLEITAVNLITEQVTP